ncbi:MAG: tail fiber protein [Marinagarivorans sp.]
MSDAYIGEIRMFAGDYAPENWMLCLGQTIAISSNNALFAVIGTIYGGDGIHTFALPDMRARMPVGTGNSGVFSPVTIGAKGGQQSVTLTQQQMPNHTHLVSVASTPSNPTSAPSATNNYLGASGAGQGLANIWSSSMGTPATLAPTTLTPVGGSSPVSIQNPYMGLSFIICTAGIFPPRP